MILLSIFTSCIDGVFSCVDDLRRPGTSEQTPRTAAAGVSGDLSRTLGELHHNESPPVIINL